MAQILSRRLMIGSLGACVVAGLGSSEAGAALSLGSGLGGLLGRASDSALDQLGKPGAFYGDPAVRIGLPMLTGAVGGSGLGGLLGQALDLGGRLGLTDGLMRRINDAAGVAAGAAKPVFRDAIGKLTLADVPDILRQRDGASQYLRKSSGVMLAGKLRPMVDSALVKVGAGPELDRLGKSAAGAGLVGITRQAIGKSVTDQAMNGIFAYIGREEGKLRDDPVGPASSLLKGLLGG